MNFCVLTTYKTLHPTPFLFYCHKLIFAESSFRSCSLSHVISLHPTLIHTKKWWLAVDVENLLRTSNWTYMASGIGRRWQFWRSSWGLMASCLVEWVLQKLIVTISMTKIMDVQLWIIQADSFDRMVKKWRLQPSSVQLFIYNLHLQWNRFEPVVGEECGLKVEYWTKMQRLFLLWRASFGFCLAPKILPLHPDGGAVVPPPVHL